MKAKKDPKVTAEEMMKAAHEMIDGYLPKGRKTGHICDKIYRLGYEIEGLRKFKEAIQKFTEEL